MKAVVYHGNEDVRVEERPNPVIGDRTDAIIRVTSTGICGSDLHLYHGDIPDTRKGDILGHEFVGVVEEVGPEVRTLQRGDRVVVACFICCGTCWFCDHGLFSLCDTTNPNPVQQELYGQSTAGVYGYSHMLGGYDGGQAEFVRVPYADVGCFKLPEELSDDQGVLLADNLSTGWHGAECSNVGPETVVAVFGCGTVGLLAMESCRVKGAARIIAIDHIAYRLDVAHDHVGAEVINFDEEDPVKRLRELTMGRGPDVCIDCTGFRYARSKMHAVEKKIKLETDAIDALSDAIRSVRKGGHVAPIGDYIGFANHFPVGAMMEKQITVRGGQVNAQRYIPHLMEMVVRGEIDPTFVITHHMPLDRAAEAYQMFDEKGDNALKVVLCPGDTR